MDPGLAPASGTVTFKLLVSNDQAGPLPQQPKSELKFLQGKSSSMQVTIPSSASADEHSCFVSCCGVYIGRAGAIIGKSGAQITALQEAFGVYIKLGGPDDLFPGSFHRAAVLRGDVAALRAALVAIVDVLWKVRTLSHGQPSTTLQDSRPDRVLTCTTHPIGRPSATCPCVCAFYRLPSVLTRQPYPWTCVLWCRTAGLLCASGRDGRGVWPAWFPRGCA